MKISQYVLMLLLGWCAVCVAAESGQTLVAAELKSEPFLDAHTLATLAAGSAVEIVKRQGGWLQVKPAGNAAGWVKLTAIKLGSGAGAKGDSGLAALWNAGQSGRSGSTGVVVATGVRGLGVEELKNASANPEALKKVQGYAVSRSDAESYATKARLQRQTIEYAAVGSTSSDKQVVAGSAK
jgi:hypothetical protein